MRGALEDLPGVSETEIACGDPNVVVRYDPEKASVAQLIDALARVGERAKLRQ